MKEIWRLNMKTDGIKNVGQEGLFKFCKNESIVGIGWSDSWFIEGYKNDLKNTEEIKNYIWYKIKNNDGKNDGKTRSFSTASNIVVNRMKIKDYVWTRANGLYWIAKIIGESKFMKDDEEYKKHDIGFFRKVEFSNIGFSESEVPGKIISSFAARNSTQRVSDDNGILFKYTEALFSGDKNKKIELNDWTIFFSAEDIEEILGLYLQKEKNLYVYTSTNKKSTAKIEFELVDKKGDKYGVQVKTGNVNINGKDYKEISEKMKVFLFATNDNVNIEGNENLIHIRVDDITEFIEKNKTILPERIKKWL